MPPRGGVVRSLICDAGAGAGRRRDTGSAAGTSLANVAKTGSDGTDPEPIRCILREGVMAKAVLTISSKNYSSWSLRGWLLCRLAGLDFEEELRSSEDPSTRAELLLLSPSFLVPALTH